MPTRRLHFGIIDPLLRFLGKSRRIVSSSSGWNRDQDTIAAILDMHRIFFRAFTSYRFCTWCNYMDYIVLYCMSRNVKITWMNVFWNDELNYFVKIRRNGSYEILTSCYEILMIFIVFFLLRCIQNRVRGISFFKYNVRRNSMTPNRAPQRSSRWL